MPLFFMTILIILIFVCLRLVGDKVKSLLCLFCFFQRWFFLCFPFEGGYYMDNSTSEWFVRFCVGKLLFLYAGFEGVLENSYFNTYLPMEPKNDKNKNKMVGRHFQLNISRSQMILACNCFL